MTIESGWAVAPGLVMVLWVSLKVTAVMVVAWIVTGLARHASAAARHLVWAVAAALALVLPLLAPFVPAWRVPLPVVLPVAATAQVDNMGGSGQATRIGSTPSTEPMPLHSTSVDGPVASGGRAPAAPMSPATAIALPGSNSLDSRSGTISGPVHSGDDVLSGPPPRSGSPAAIMLFLWAAGAMVAALPWLLASLRVRRRERNAPAHRSARVRRLFDTMTAEMRIRREVRLIEGQPGTMPMTWGATRPVVMLPSDATTWSDSRLSVVLRHELAHVERRDSLTQAVAEAARIVHWFNPLLWLATKRLRAEQELACDDLVLATGADAADYAAELVGLARFMRGARPAPMAAMAITNGGPLRSRLLAVLDEARSRRRMSRNQVLSAALIGFVTCIPLACLAPARSTPAVAPQEPRAEAAAVVSPEVPGRVVQAVPAPARRAEVLPEVLPPEPRAEAVPAVPTPVTRPTPAVTPLEPAAPVRLGAPAAAPREAESSLSVVPVEPASATAPEPAVRVTAEQAPEPALVVQVLRHATARSLGDRQMVQLLETTVATGSIANGAVRSAYTAAAATVDGDRDRAGVLELLIVSGFAETADFEDILELSAQIGSDSQLADLLLAVLDQVTVTGTLRETFLRALETVGSDREKNRVSAALLRQGG